MANMANMESSAASIQIADWDAADRATAGVTLRLSGASQAPYEHFNFATHTGDEVAQVQANRKLLQRKIGAQQIQWLQQVHGTHCIAADAQSAAGQPVADAAWTRQRRLALAIMTADCVPVVLAHQQGDVVGAAHAGWQGLRDGVIARLLQQMPAAPEQLCAWIGPSIRRRNYEVGEDVWSYFSQHYPSCVFNQRIGPDVPGEARDPSATDSGSAKRWLDLAAVAAQQLRHGGVPQVTDCGWCSYGDPRFYSHRQAMHQGQAATGRMTTFVMLT